MFEIIYVGSAAIATLSAVRYYLNHPDEFTVTQAVMAPCYCFMPGVNTFVALLVLERGTRL